MEGGTLIFSSRVCVKIIQYYTKRRSTKYMYNIPTYIVYIKKNAPCELFSRCMNMCKQ